MSENDAFMREFKMSLFYLTKCVCVTFKSISRWEIMIPLASLSPQECVDVLSLCRDPMNCSTQIHLQMRKVRCGYGVWGATTRI